MVLAIPMGPSVPAGEPGRVGHVGDSEQGGPSTSPTPTAWWGPGSRGLGFGGDPVRFSEPSEGGGPPQSEPPALGLRCPLTLRLRPPGSSAMGRRPGLFSTWGNSLSLGFFAVRILTACGYVRCTCVWVPVSMTECSMQKEAVFLIYRMSKMAGLALSWEDHAPVGQNDVTWLSVLNITEG